MHNNCVKKNIKSFFFLTLGPYFFGQVSTIRIFNFMTVGIWQFLAIILLLLLFFGNFSHILKDLAEGINIFKKTLRKINQ
mmetsp:Transcript_12518/g.32323  ORF Transcript_12518/g.32323 Transcript_12518/m.32323 type:complete len:80 (+) Transcript_12518:2607-2846(+)